jgi:glycine/D-amino acid oxidase-like deaminating enzyme
MRGSCDRADGQAKGGEIRQKTSVVIIGGGIVGVSAALWLARDGIPVVLCEKGDIGREQSGRNWGWCRTFGRDMRELELSLLSLRLWRQMNEITQEETGFRQSGIVTMAADEKHHSELRRLVDGLKGSPADAVMVTGDVCERLATGASRGWIGGLYSATDGRAEPGLAAPAIARAAARAGADIVTGCKVIDIEKTNGRVSSVVIDRGRIECDAVLICAGAWTTRLCRKIGFRLPQLIVNESVSRTAPVAGGPEVALRTRDFSLRRRLDGGYTIGGGGLIRAELTPDSFAFLADFIPMLKVYGRVIRLHPTSHSRLRWRALLTGSMPMDTLDPSPDIGLTRRVCAAAARDFPIFNGVAIEERWAGAIDVTPDAIPVISPLPVDGAFVATGFSGHGFGMGPGAGALAAALVSNKLPLVDPRAFHVDRLATAGKLALGPL